MSERLNLSVDLEAITGAGHEHEIADARGRMRGRNRRGVPYEIKRYDAIERDRWTKDVRPQAVGDRWRVVVTVGEKLHVSLPVFKSRAEAQDRGEYLILMLRRRGEL